MEDATANMADTIAAMIEAVGAVLTTYGLSVVGAIVTLIIGVWFAGYASRLTGKALEKRSRVDDTLSKFFESFVRYLVLAVVVVAVLNQFGVETASLVAVLATAGLAIGLALQGTLTNVASGIMLLFFRPFKVGDYVSAGGQTGTIKELNLFFTVMATPDNVQITIPNGQVWGSAVSNYSANPTRRVEIVAGISYDTDIDKAMVVVHETVSADPRIKSDPEPFVAVTEMADSSVNFTIRVWVDNGDMWPVKFDLTKAIKQAFDANGIGIPFPTRTVHTVVN
jgi:small conductance mechanosensitive channel